jgi:RNA polymerase-binding protein DksA
VAKNAPSAKAAVEAPVRDTTKTTATRAESRRTTGGAAGTEPAPPAPPTPRGARGTGAGAKAATGRSSRTSTTSAPSSTRRRAPAHTAAAAGERVETAPVPPATDWTAEELAEVRTDLGEQLTKLRSDYDRAIADLHNLQRSSNDGAGDDQADAGSKTFEREQELSIANNRRDLMTQVERALERLDKGTYGRCESCSQPIPKPRLQAFPSATLCVKCKQREERR